MTEDQIRDFLEDDANSAFSIDDVSDEILLKESGKMALTLALAKNLRAEGEPLVLNLRPPCCV